MAEQTDDSIKKRIAKIHEQMHALQEEARTLGNELHEREAHAVRVARVAEMEDHEVEALERAIVDTKPHRAMRAASRPPGAEKIRVRPRVPR